MWLGEAGSEFVADALLEPADLGGDIAFADAEDLGDLALWPVFEIEQQQRAIERRLARDEVLEKVVWPFTVRIQALAPLTVGTLLPGWTNQFQAPADMLSALEISPSADVSSLAGYYTDCCGPWMPPRAARYAFRKAQSADGTATAILCNMATPYLVYSARVIDTAQYSALCVSAIADRLAMELAMPMTVDPRWFQVAQQRFVNTFTDAASRAFEQETAQPDPTPAAIQARY